MTWSVIKLSFVGKESEYAVRVNLGLILLNRHVNRLLQLHLGNESF